MNRRIGRAIAAVVCGATAFCLTLGVAVADAASDCERAGAAAEAAAALPNGLLLAIGHVESGRPATDGRAIVSWPWTIDVAGQGRFLPDKRAAIAETQALLDSGQRNIDVGCFQINLLHHPQAFPSLEQAFDPAANAAYAAKFLNALFARYGNWADAVAAYHSVDPGRGGPYRSLVFAAWRSPLATLRSALGFPLVTSMHIWLPSAAGTAPRIVTLARARDANANALPRVITPGG